MEDNEPTASAPGHAGTRRLSLRPSTLEVEAEETVEPSRAPAGQRTKLTREQRIELQRLFRQDPPLAVSEISNITGLSRHVVSRYKLAVTRSQTAEDATEAEYKRLGSKLLPTAERAEILTRIARTGQGAIALRAIELLHELEGHVSSANLKRKPADPAPLFILKSSPALKVS